MNASSCQRARDPVQISVIVLFYNEAENICPVLNEIVAVMRPLHRNFEILAVDDGSHDQTPAILKDQQSSMPELRIMKHERNLGQGVAFWTGFTNASGEVVVTMDGDGQNDPRDIPRMLDLLRQYDAVFGQRTVRQDPLRKRIGTRIGYAFRRAILNDPVRDTSCTLKAMKRATLQCLVPTRRFFLFIPFLYEAAGIPFITLEVNHRPRRQGRSKYSMRKLFFLPMLGDLFFMWWYKKNCVLRSGYEKTHP